MAGLGRIAAARLWRLHAAPSAPPAPSVPALTCRLHWGTLSYLWPLRAGAGGRRGLVGAVTFRGEPPAPLRHVGRPPRPATALRAPVLIRSAPGSAHHCPVLIQDVLVLGDQTSHMRQPVIVGHLVEDAGDERATDIV